MGNKLTADELAVSYRTALDRLRAKAKPRETPCLVENAWRKSVAALSTKPKT